MMADTAPTQAEPVFPIREYLHILWHRRWGVIIAFLVTAGLGVLYTMKQPKIYEAVTAVIINPEPPTINPLDSSAAAEQWFLRDTYYDTQLKVMQSRNVASRVIEDLGLATDVDFFELGDVKDPAVVMKRIESSDPVARLLSMLKVESIANTRLVNIRIRNRDPRLAKDLADAIAKAYAEQNSEHRLVTLNNTYEFIDKQYRDNEAKLKEARDALNAFKENHKILYSNPIEQQKITNQRLDYLNNRQVEIEVQRKQIGFLLDQLKQIPLKIENVRAYGIIGDNTAAEATLAECVALEHEVEKLLLTYLDQSPQVKSKRAQVDKCRESVILQMKNIRTALEAKYQAYVKLNNDIDGRIRALQKEALELDQLRLLYEQFESQKEEQERLFEQSQKKMNEVSLNRLLEVNNIRILDEAVTPAVPVSPNLVINGAITLLAAIIMGLLTGFILELLDITVRTQKDVEQRARLPFLGAVPKYPRSRKYAGRNAYRYIIENPHSTVSECIRTLRTTLSFLLKDGTSHVLLVTSPQPLDGKTMMSVNLAVTSALGGQKVVLVEADLRRPRIYKVFRQEPELGFAAVIQGKHSLDEVLLGTDVEGLKLLPCGEIPNNPAELFHTKRFEELVTELRSKFDLVIIDSPPVTVVTDALLIAQHVHGVIVVARSGKTPLPLLVRARELLESVQAPILGTVLNDMSSQEQGYYGGYYYNKAYKD